MQHGLITQSAYQRVLYMGQDSSLPGIIFGHQYCTACQVDLRSGEAREEVVPQKAAQTDSLSVF
jgi:hypothetical protein